MHTYCLLAGVDVFQVFGSVFVDRPKLLVQAYLVQDLLGTELLKYPCPLVEEYLVVLCVFHPVYVNDRKGQFLEHVLFYRYPDELCHRLVQGYWLYRLWLAVLQLIFSFLWSSFLHLLLLPTILYLLSIYTRKPIIYLINNLCCVINWLWHQTYTLLNILERIHIIFQQTLCNASNLINVIR